jgi:Skp family chaperone for outer membrane proteins
MRDRGFTSVTQDEENGTVKRTVTIAAALAVLAYGASLVSRTSAQQNNPAQQRAPLQTRIALLNLAEVIKNYNKVKTFELTFKDEVKYYQAELEKKRTEALAIQEKIKKPDTPNEQREALQKQFKALERELQDRSDDIKQKLAKKDFDLMVQIYKEVRDTAATVARTYQIDLVLQYNDVPREEEFNPAVFQRKMGNPACMPMYYDERMDITSYVTKLLNDKLASTTTPATKPQGG